MQIRISKMPGGWDIAPLAGKMEGEVIGLAEGVSLRYVLVRDGGFEGEALSVWGLSVTHPRFYDDPQTVLGLGLGRGFDMRDQTPLLESPGGYKLHTGEGVIGAQHLWTMGNDVQVFNPRLRRTEQQDSP